jgi:hypothetical protein
MVRGMSQAELEYQAALTAAEGYLDELVAEVGEPSQRTQSQADAIARRIWDHAQSG